MMIKTLTGNTLIKAATIKPATATIKMAKANGKDKNSKR